jgi:hypothetical protein
MKKVEEAHDFFCLASESGTFSSMAKIAKRRIAIYGEERWILVKSEVRLYFEREKKTDG